MLYVSFIAYCNKRHIFNDLLAIYIFFVLKEACCRPFYIKLPKKQRKLVLSTLMWFVYNERFLNKVMLQVFFFLGGKGRIILGTHSLKEFLLVVLSFIAKSKLYLIFIDLFDIFQTHAVALSMLICRKNKRKIFVFKSHLRGLFATE